MWALKASSVVAYSSPPPPGHPPRRHHPPAQALQRRQHQLHAALPPEPAASPPLHAPRHHTSTRRHPAPLPDPDLACRPAGSSRRRRTQNLAARRPEGPRRPTRSPGLRGPRRPALRQTRVTRPRRPPLPTSPTRRLLVVHPPECPTLASTLCSSSPAPSSPRRPSRTAMATPSKSQVHASHATVASGPLQGRSKKKESARKKERGKKRTSSAFDTTNDIANEENFAYNLDEPTMEERLATLNLINQDNERNDNEEQSLSMAPLSADSVHILLKQALRADDNVSLLNCLYNRDEKVILKSISLLTPADVVKLLKFFVLQIQSRGAVLVCLLPWLQTLLSRHMSSIVAQESSLLLLNSLYQLIDARTSTFKSALQLSTTLDYLFSEAADDEADEEEAVPLIIYEDKDTDEEESEVDAMETDGEAEELGDVTDASEHSDGSEIMSD